MFADPAAITINSVEKSLVKINQDGYSSEYLLRNADDEYRLFIRNTTRVDRKTNQSFDRHNVELVHNVFATAEAPAITRKAYVVIENQKGDTLTDPVLMTAGLLAWLTASTNANLTKLMSFQS
jgi:hypothetical protein